MADFDSELEKAEEEEVLAIDRLVKEMLLKNVLEDRKVKPYSTEVHFVVTRKLRNMSDDEKNGYRDTFRNYIRNKISDPEGNKGSVLTINDDDILMLQAIEAVQTLDTYRAAAEQQHNEAEQHHNEAEQQHNEAEQQHNEAEQQQNVAEQQNAEGQHSPEEKGDSPYENQDSAEAKGDSKGKRPLSPEVKGDSPKDKRKGKRPHSDDAGGSSKRAARD